MKENSSHINGAAIAERAIQKVFVARSPSGAPLHQIVVRLKTYKGLMWHVLDSGELQHGKTASLIRMMDYIGGDMPLLAAVELKHLCRMLLSRATEAITVVHRGGYYQFKSKNRSTGFFAHAGKTYLCPSCKGERIVHIQSGFSSAGGESKASLTDWKREVGVFFEGNPYLIVGLGCALSAALIEPLRLSPLVYAMVGPSSSGKSTVQKAIQSLCRKGDVLDSASGTALGIHQLASEYSDAPLLLDEIRQLRDADGLISFLFDIGNSSERKVGTASQTALRGGRLRCSVITANEKTIAEFAARKGVGIDAGLYARVFEVRLEGKAGAFDRIPEGMSAARFAERIGAMSGRFHSAVWPAWLKLIAGKMKKVRETSKEQFKKRRSELAAIANIEDRVGRRMLRGLVAWEYAVLIAANEGLVPLTVDGIKQAFEEVLRRHQARRTEKVSPREQEIVDRFSGLLEQNRKKFARSDADAAQMSKPWGYVRQENGQTYYCWFKEEFIRAAGEFGKEEAARALKSAGFLRVTGDGITYVIKVKGDSIRTFAVSDAIRFEPRS